MGISPVKATLRTPVIHKRWRDIIGLCSPQKKPARRDLSNELAIANASLRVTKGIIVGFRCTKLRIHCQVVVFN